MRDIRLFIASATVVALLASTPAAAQETVRLWPGVAPGSEGWTQHEVVTKDTPIGTVIINVVTPELAVYLPEAATATGTGIVVAPGGYCVALAIEAEGQRVARWLQQHGIAAFVLKYRTLEKKGEGIPKDLNMAQACRYGIADGIQALRVVRDHAAAWHIVSNRVGILGFSAGAMVASGTLLQPDAAARPDFAGLIYGAPFGAIPAVPGALPPIFMAWAQDDQVAGTTVAKFYDALMAAGHRPEAHVLASGGHGFGMGRPGTSSDGWIEDFYRWMKATRVMKSPR